MKRITLLASILFCYSTMFAQHYEIKNVVELQRDLTARVDVRKDAKGQECAFVRVNIPSVKNVKFVTETVGETINLPGEYGVYVPANTSSLSVMVNNESYSIDFAKYDISIAPKTTYRVVMNKVNTVSVNNMSAKVSINANYDNVIVLIDGTPVGQTPLVAEGLSLGKHVVSVPNASGVTMNDMTIDVKGDTKLTLKLHKERAKEVSVDLATPGGDTGNWYKVFGTTRFTENGLMGVKDYTGKVLVPCEYDAVYPDIQNGYYVVWKDDKVGLYEPTVGLTVPCIYDGGIKTSHSVEHDSYMPAQIGKKYGVLNPNGKLVVPVEYDEIDVNDNFICAKKDGKCGVLTLEGEVLVPFEYKNVTRFYEDHALYSKGEWNADMSYGILFAEGDEAPLPDNLSVDVSSDGISSGMFPVQDKQTKKWGYMKVDGDIVVPIEHDKHLPSFNNGVAMIEEDVNQILIDPQGKEILNSSKLGCAIEAVYHADKHDADNNSTMLGCHWYCINPYEKAEFVRTKNSEGKCGVLSLEGKEIVPCRYGDYNLKWFKDGELNYFAVTDDEETKVLNDNGETLITLPAELSISHIVDGIVKVTEEMGSYGYLNLEGDVIANCIYGDYADDVASDVNEEEEETPGTIQYSMRELVDEYPISEGLAILKIGDRLGLIDVTGKVVLPLEYTGITPFENGIAFVRDKQGTWKKIKRTDL